MPRLPIRIVLGLATVLAAQPVAPAGADPVPMPPYCFTVDEQGFCVDAAIEISRAPDPLTGDYTASLVISAGLYCPGIPQCDAVLPVATVPIARSGLAFGNPKIDYHHVYKIIRVPKVCSPVDCWGPYYFSVTAPRMKGEVFTVYALGHAFPVYGDVCRSVPDTVCRATGDEES